MSVPYPGGGTPPTSFAPVQPIHEQVVHHVGGFALTGSDARTLALVALAVIVVSVFMVVVSSAGRK